MTSAERAKAICDAENQFCEEHSLFVRADTLDRLEAAIAAAITQAQNDKLEEAASWFEDQAKMTREAVNGLGLPAALSEPIGEIMDGIPADLRNLKSKD